MSDFTNKFPKGPNYKWIVICLLFLAGFLNLEDRVVIFSVLPLIRQELKLTDVQLGALMSVFLWVYAIASPLAGYVGDRFSRRNVIIGCVLLWSIVTIAAGFASSFRNLMTTRVLLGLTQAFYIPASLATVSDWHDATTRGKAVALLVVGMNLGPIMGGFAAGWIGDHYGWRPTLVLLGIAGVFLAILLWLGLRNVAVGASDRAPAEKPAPFWSTLKELSRIPSYLCLATAIGVFALATWMLTTWLPILLHDTYGMNLANSGFLGNLAITGPILLGFLAGGTLSDAAGHQNPRNRMLLMLACYGLALPWPLVFRAAATTWLVLASAFLFQLFRAFGESNSYPVMYELVPPEKRSTAIGISNSMNTALGGLGALVVGYFYRSRGLQGVFGMVPMLIMVAIAGLLLSVLRFLKRDLCRSAHTPLDSEQQLEMPEKAAE